MDKSRFSIWGLIFNSAYYVGKGKVKKGIVLGLLALIPLIGTIGVPVYCGMKANEELGESEFSWKRAIIYVLVFTFLLSSFVKGVKNA